jgi:peroxiredoxin
MVTRRLIAWVWVPLGLALLGAIALAISALRPAGAVHVGREAPEVSLPLLEGGELSLSSLRGKVVLLDFFATWCRPCREEMPSVIRLAEREGPNGLAVVGVNWIEHEPDGPPVVEYFVRRANLPFPVVLDVGDAATQLYRVEAIPTLFLIDRAGVVRAVYQGVQDEAELTQAIQALLSE